MHRSTVTSRAVPVSRSAASGRPGCGTCAGCAGSWRSRAWAHRRGGDSTRHAGQLGPRMDVRLPVDVAQVVLDGLLAEEQCGRRLLVAGTAPHHQGDLQLLRRQPEHGVGVTAYRLPGGAQFRLCALRPGYGAEPVEGVECVVQLYPCLGTLP